MGSLGALVGTFLCSILGVLEDRWTFPRGVYPLYDSRPGTGVCLVGTGRVERSVGDSESRMVSVYLGRCTSRTHTRGDGMTLLPLGPEVYLGLEVPEDPSHDGPTKRPGSCW